MSGAVIAYLISGCPDQARALVETTASGESWDQAITTLLATMSHNAAPSRPSTRPPALALPLCPLQLLGYSVGVMAIQQMR